MVLKVRELRLPPLPSFTTSLADHDREPLRRSAAHAVTRGDLNNEPLASLRPGGIADQARCSVVVRPESKSAGQTARLPERGGGETLADDEELPVLADAEDSLAWRDDGRRLAHGQRE